MTQNTINTTQPIIQKVVSTTASVIACTGNIPSDDSIPQIGEGTEIITATITPKTSTSILEIVFIAPMIKDTTAGANSLIVALFQDATSNALAASSSISGTTSAGRYQYLKYVMTSGTTSSTTFRIRGGIVSGTSYINANTSGTRLMGGVSKASLTITEYL